MPRIKRGFEPPRVHFPALVKELADELKSNREAGQPLIEEQHFIRTGAIRVNVIWDKWAPVPDEERSAIILQAYEEVEGKDYRDRIALSIGLTVPEASEMALLPFHVIPALRKNDPVTLEQCRQAMHAQGASVLFEPDNPQLCFATREEAEACVKRLVKQLPNSEPVWVISQELARAAQ